MITLLMLFVMCIVFGTLGIVFAPILFLGWHLFRFVFKTALILGMLGLAFSLAALL